MGKKDTVMDKKNSKAPKAEPSMHGVTITVLVESSTVRSHRKPDQIKKSSRTHGYDRRAQLLAYSRELRYAHSHKIEWPIWNSRRKPKKPGWSPSLSRFPLSFNNMFCPTKRQWRYERIVSEEKASETTNSRKTKGSERSSSRFCRKIRCMLRELSCGWQCNKGW